MKGRIEKATLLHEAVYQDFLDCLKRHAATLPAEEILALVSNVVGKIIAMQDQRTMNLLFRWDWREGEGYELPPFNGDVNYRNGRLLFFWMGQRKGLYQWSEIEVCRADEAAVIEYLKPRLAHLLKMWAPIAEASHV